MEIMICLAVQAFFSAGVRLVCDVSTPPAGTSAVDGTTEIGTAAAGDATLGAAAATALVTGTVAGKELDIFPDGTVSQLIITF